MCTYNSRSGCDCLCECDILLAEDRNLCPEHGRSAQAAKAREMRVPRWVTAIDEIEQMVESLYYDGRITSQQRSLFRWAARKAREVESPAWCSRCAQSLDGVEEL